MQLKLVLIVSAVFSLLFLSGCGSTGSSSSTTHVTVPFASPLPMAVAEQIGTGPWTAASLQGGQLNLTIPSGTDNYAIAYICPAPQNKVENVFEATLEDNPAGGTCGPQVGSPPPTGTITGSVDATAIPGTAYVLITGLATQTMIIGAQGAFTLKLPELPIDIAAIAEDLHNNPLAIQILRSQSVPGQVNGGNPIVFSASDEVTLQPVTNANLPNDFSPILSVLYFTANHTSFLLNNLSTSQYAAVPVSQTESGDSYSFNASAFNTVGSNAVDFQGVEIRTTLTTAAPITLSFPTPLPYSPPAPAAAPSFPVNYSGFSDGTKVSYAVSVGWLANQTSNGLNLIATSAYQNGRPDLIVPDLSSLPGFLPKPASGVTLSWFLSVSDDLTPETSSVTNSGQYIVP